MAYAALLPLSVYSMEYLPLFQSSVLIVNTFLPLFAFLAVRVLLKSPARDMIRSLKKQLTPTNVAMIALFILSFQWIMERAFVYAGLNIPMLLQLVILLTLFSMLFRMPHKPLIMTAATILLLRMIIDLPSIMSWGFVTYFTQIFVLFVLLRSVILEMSFSHYSVPVPIVSLRTGMVPAESVILTDNNYSKEKIDFFSIGMRNKQKGSRIVLGTGVLTNENLTYIKKLHSSGRLPFDKIRIHQTVPFAPFMFLGVILTVLLHGSIVNLLGSLF
jgi:hypothetical protein